MKIQFILVILIASLNQALAQDSAFDSTENPLTVEDEAAAANYIHQGKADQQYREMCFDEDVFL